MNLVTNNKWIGQRTIRPDGMDKVTGRAQFAADTTMPGMIWGKVLRSPHPHARIKSIDTSKAEKLPGVKAVVTAKDIVDFTIEKGAVMLGIQDMRWMCRNVMARDKALFPGHPVAAVAATTEAIAAEACSLIEVDYEVLPWSIEIDDAIKPDAAILHEFNKFEGKPSNIAGRIEHKKGDLAEGFKKADVVIERTFTTRPVHQGYIEPHACLISVAPDGKTTIWSSSQGQFMVRAMTLDVDRHSAERHPRHPRRDRRRLWRQDHRLSRTARDHAGEKIRPPGEDGDDARGSDARDRPDLRLEEHGEDRRHQGRQDNVAAHGTFYLQAGAFPGSPIRGAAGCSFTPYDIPNLLSEGYDVVLQPLEGRGLSRAGRADRRLCRGMRARRSRRSAEDGSARLPPEERREGRHQGRARPGVPAHRIYRDAGSCEELRSLQGAARQASGQGRSLRLLVQRRRRILGAGQHHRGRQRRRHHRPSRHRRFARGHRQYLC